MGTRARWDGGRVTFATSQEFEQEFTSFISKGALLVSGPGLPDPLEPFDFTLEPPGGMPVRLRGMIVSATSNGSLIQIMDFSSALVGGIEGGAPAAGSLPPVPGPPGTAAGSTPAAGQGVLLAAAAVPEAVRVPAPGVSAVTAARMAALGRSITSPPPDPSGAVPSASQFGRETSSVRPATGVFPLAGGVTSGPMKGELVNPEDLASLRTLPLGPVAAVRDLSSVTTVGLVRYLGARRATGWLTLRGPGGAERRWAFEKGAVLLATHEREAARPAFAWPTGSFEFEPAIPDRPPNRSPVLAWRLVLDAVRARIRESTVEELRALVDVGKAVRLGAAYLERSRSLDLTPPEERVIKRDFDGRLALREIAKLGALSEIALFRLVYLLDVLGLVDMVPPQAGAGAARDEIRESYERLVHEDLFTAIGVHWSDSPDRLAPALEKLRRRYGPGSPAAEQSPEYAARIVELAERAYRRLKDRSERRRYRQELNLDVRHAAELLMVQVPIARARGEVQRAYELVSAACDLWDNPAWERLKRELGGGAIGS